MSLATRCTHCGTVFRVVHDQLKVSEGWVRCGKCQQVFSAMDGLFDLDAKPATAPATAGSAFAPSPAAPHTSIAAEATPRTNANAGTAPSRTGGNLFDQPFFTPADKAASVWRGKRGGDAPADRLEPERPAAFDPPVPIVDRSSAGGTAGVAGATPPFEDEVGDGRDALQIQPLDQEEAPFVLRRPAIEARAFDRPHGLRDLPGADALRRATAERDAQTETMPATFDRANVDDWRPADADADLSDVAAARGLHIDLLIDDVDRPGAAAAGLPIATSARRPVADPMPRHAVDIEADTASGAASNTAADSHVLGGTLIDGSLEEDIADTADPPPAFLRDAERRSWRDTPGQRRAWLGGAAALAVLLGLQLVFHSRDVLAARFPAMSTPLAAMCAMAGCTLGPPRRIDDVVVDSSALTRVEGLDAFQLTVVLRNRSNMTLAMPAIDLSLTDTDGQLVSRRALLPADFAAPAAATSSVSSLAASGEQTLKLLLSAGERRVTGYTVELFYP